MDPVSGALLGTAASGVFGSALGFAGGLMGQSQQAAQIAAQMNQQQQQFDRQMEFAREQMFTGTSARDYQLMSDAKAYGISPLVMLGAPSVSLPGIPAGDISGNVGSGANPFASAASSISNMGQDMSRAILATRTPEEKERMKAQTNFYVKQNEKVDSEIEVNKSRAALFNSQATAGPSFPSVAGAPHGQGNTQDSDKGNADIAYRTNTGIMEYQAAPGTPASQTLVEGAFATARNRGGSLMNSLDPGRVGADIRRLYPGAVGYAPSGTGFRPIYPDEQVRADVQQEIRDNRSWYDPRKYLK